MKPEMDKRTEVMPIRLTKKEKEEVQKQAKLEFDTPSGWSRRHLLGLLPKEINCNSL